MTIVGVTADGQSVLTERFFVETNAAVTKIVQGIGAETVLAPNSFSPTSFECLNVIILPRQARDTSLAEKLGKRARRLRSRAAEWHRDWNDVAACPGGR